MGVLRSIGMSKKDVYKLVLVEAVANLLAALTLGIIIGYAGTYMSMTTMMMMAECNTELTVDWPVIIIMAILCLIGSLIGTSVGVKVVNDRKIANILKMG